MPAKRYEYFKATVKLNCHCSFDIPPETYKDYNPQDLMKCDQHGEQYVLRVSRLGAK